MIVCGRLPLSPSLLFLQCDPIVASVCRPLHHSMSAFMPTVLPQRSWANHDESLATPAMRVWPHATAAPPSAAGRRKTDRTGAASAQVGSSGPLGMRGGVGTATPATSLFRSRDVHHSLLQSSSGPIYAALIDNRAAEVGVAICTLGTLKITVTQVSDSVTFSKTLAHLFSYHPCEVILPQSSVGGPLAEAVRCAIAEHDDAAGVTAPFSHASTFHVTSPPSTAIIALHRRCFNETAGVQRLSELCATPEVAAELSSASAPYLGISAAAALVQYIESVQHCTFVPRTVRVEVVTLARHMTVDRAAHSALNLIASPRSDQAACASRPRSLATTIDTCQTAMGRRLLRANILQPLNDEATIEARRDVCEWLLSPEGALRGHARIKSLLARFGQPIDFEKALVMISHEPHDHHAPVHMEALLDALVGILHCFEAVVPLHDALESIASDAAPLSIPVLITSIRSAIAAVGADDVTKEMRRWMDAAVTAAAAPPVAGGHRCAAAVGAPRRAVAVSSAMRQTQRCHVVREGISSYLDVARQLCSQSVDRIIALCESLKLQQGLRSLRVGFDLARGYHFTIQAREGQLLDPAVFCCRGCVSDGGPGTDLPAAQRSVACATKELISLNAAFRDACVDVLQAQCNVLAPLLDYLRQNISRWHALCEAVALLDVLVAFATYAQVGGVFCRPTRTADNAGNTSNAEPQSPPPSDGGTLKQFVLEHSRHPSLHQQAGGPGRVTAQPRFAVCAPQSFCVLLGPNASGKTTLLQHIGQTVVLAQIGCFVPSARAVLPLFDHLLIRFSAVDDPCLSASGFTQEMRALSSILQRATKHSLVLIDELGRSTSTMEATALCWATARWIMDTGATCVLATHLAALAALATEHPRTACLKHLHVDVDHRDSLRLRYTHQVMEGGTVAAPQDASPGAAALRHYGLTLARQLHVSPFDVVCHASGLVARVAGQVNEPTDVMDRCRYLLALVRALMARKAAAPWGPPPPTHERERLSLPVLLTYQ